MPRREINREDLSVYVSLLALGALQLALSGWTRDFTQDPYYYELARSFLTHTGYGFNSRPEPMVPPGFPALLAVMMVAFGQSYAVLIRLMAFFATFGLIAAYELLKRKEGRVIAAVVCVLLASSPSWFEFSTRSLFSDMPYFLTSMLFLLAAARLASTATRGRQAVVWVLCAALLAASVLLRSTGIALAGGVLGWLSVSMYRERRWDRRLVALFVPLAVVGAVTEMSWLLWAEKHPVTMWPVHGFQESYVAQLKLKNGNDPELGFATWRDVAKRPLENEDDMATSMVALYLHKAVAPAWYSPTTVIPLVLLAAGLASSFRGTGGTMAEWYFVCYQFLYLFWPWNFELRFQLPVAPLAALYMWRGAGLLWSWTRRIPRRAGTSGLLVAGSGLLSSVIWGWRIEHPPVMACIAVWVVVAALGAVVLWGGPDLMRWLWRVAESTVAVRGIAVSGARAAGGVAVVVLLTAGVWRQALAGVENLRAAPEMDPSVEAAEWIRGHSPAGAVVMARWEARVYHYSGHRVIWFPASTDAQLLMAGIRRNNIRLIVVTDADEGHSYWKPSDGECFRTLVRAYPALFHTVHMGAHEQVYELSGDL
ncbi:MAG: glycosyltransferase family 39 protein [Bryobacterales bacterium]|nr:glycosyltransferase family 39 protein [Bryobacterales bacterium]